MDRVVSPKLQLILGALSGLSVLSILWADNWYKLGFGWVTFATVVIWTVMTRGKTNKPAGKRLLELGPPIYQMISLNKKVLVLLGIFVTLLGVAGVGMSLAETETKNPDALPGGLFLLGAGLACLAIPNGQRQLLSFSYLVWALAGTAMVFGALTQVESSVEVARGVTLGSVLLIVGLIAAYNFMFSKTALTADGLSVGRSLVPWDAMKSWAIVKESDGASNLKIHYKNAASILTAHVPSDRVEEASRILTTHLGSSSV